MQHGPVSIDDTVGELLETQEGFPRAKAEAVRSVLLAAGRHGENRMPLKALLRAGENAVGAILTDGWHIGRVGLTGDSCQYADRLAFLFQLDVTYPDGCYLVFGREDRGINEKILAAHYDRCVRFPMLDDDSARSLNLSNSVAIGVYEALRQQGFTSLRTRGELTGREEPDIL